MIEQRLKRALEPIGRDCLRPQEDGLIPVVWMRKILIEEDLLDRKSDA